MIIHEKSTFIDRFMYLQKLEHRVALLAYVGLEMHVDVLEKHR